MTYFKITFIYLNKSVWEVIFLYYIQEADKPSSILNKLFNILNIVKLQDNRIILPIGKKKMSDKKAEKLAKKVNHILTKMHCRKIVLSKKLKKEEQFVNELYSYNYNIVDGKWLFELLSEKVLDYIVNKKKLEKQEIQLSILVNDLSEVMLQTIKKLLQQYKKINIVTNHITKFKKVEDKMLEEQGIMIVVNNNKRRSLAKSQLILNVDFPSELINNYNIYEEAIIVNIRNNVKIKRKRFNGININNYEIKFEKMEQDNYNEIEKFSKKDLYEAQINQKQPFENMIRQIQKDKVEIEELIANNIKI